VSNGLTGRPYYNDTCGLLIIPFHVRRRTSWVVCQAITSSSGCFNFFQLFHFVFPFLSRYPDGIANRARSGAGVGAGAGCGQKREDVRVCTVVDSCWASALQFQ